MNALNLKCPIEVPPDHVWISNSLYFGFISKIGPTPTPSCKIGPAKFWKDGDRAHYIDGIPHRIEGPYQYNIHGRKSYDAWAKYGFILSRITLEWATTSGIDLYCLDEKDWDLLIIKEQSLI